MSTKPSTTLAHSPDPRREASQAAFSAFGVFLSILALVATVALVFGSFLQLTSRLTLAESQVRLLQVNQKLLTQELEIERLMGSRTGGDVVQLASLQVIALHPTPSPWRLDSHFDVVWDDSTGIGVLSIHGKIGDTSAHDLQLRIKVLREDMSLDTIPIPTQKVPESHSKRWFELLQTDHANVTGFELVMFLGDDSPDSVKFTGDLDR